MSLDVTLGMTVDTGGPEKSWLEVYTANITHNLTDMAEEAGIYKTLWRPEEDELNTAGSLIPSLEAGLKKLKGSPEHYKKFNSPNGWGTYEHFVPFVEKYLEACILHPLAEVDICR